MANDIHITCEPVLVKSTAVDVIIDPIHETDEKLLYELGLDSSDKSEWKSHEESQYDFTSEEFASIPELVRHVVSFEDDPSLPVLTFRSILLSIIFCIIGSVVSQIS
jgi:hypothetical protein